MLFPKTISELNNQYDNIEFVNIAYRPEPERATGGPNGVVKTVQECFGIKYKGFMQRYIYEPKNIVLPENYIKFFKENKIGTMTKKLVEAEYYMTNCLYKNLPIKNFQGTKNQYIFICHDIGSAVGAYRIGCPYYLVYHQQGSFVHERESFGETLSDIEKDIMNTYENIAFQNAQKIFFPSLGAQKSFCETTSIKYTTSNFAKEPLYNTVTDFPVDIAGAKVFLQQHGLSRITEEKENNIVFMSIGDYSKNKGIDRVPEVISKIASKTNKSITWIVVGSKHKSGIYESLVADQDNNKFNFKTLFIPNRLEHSLAMGILYYCDYFIMLQRHSIFDFSTLEAMKMGKKIILSAVGGNLEFNKENNVFLLHDTMLTDENISNILSYKENNSLHVFNKYFSPQNFMQAYSRLYDDAIEKFIGERYIDPSEFIYDNELQELLQGKEVVICGPGKSLRELNFDKYPHAVFIALNSAALEDRRFHIHIMQDNPPDINMLLKYCSKNMKRLYGIINNKRNSHMIINFDYLKEINIPFTTYQLSNFIFDTRFDSLNIDNNKHIIEDMGGVLFSAMQLCAMMHVKKIYFSGIDFSTDNIHGKNKNKYNMDSINNFSFCLESLSKYGIDFEILSTYSQAVACAVNKYSSSKYFVNPDSISKSAILDSKNMNKNNTHAKYKKIKKLIRDPKLFFIDMLKNLLKNS